jgi:hypothetical protein
VTVYWFVWACNGVDAQTANSKASSTSQPCHMACIGLNMIGAHIITRTDRQKLVY